MEILDFSSKIYHQSSSSLSLQNFSNDFMKENSTNENILKQDAFVLDVEHSHVTKAEKILKMGIDQLSDSDKTMKDLIQSVFDRLSSSNSTIYPNEETGDSIQTEENPYENYGARPAVFNGRLIPLNADVYYEKRTFDFNAKVQIQTPNELFEMEISISITQELLIASDLGGKIGQERFDEPFVFNHHEDKNPLENYNNLGFLFDIVNEDEKEFFEFFEEGMEFVKSKDVDSTNKEEKEEDTILAKLLKVIQTEENNQNSLVSLVDFNISEGLYFSFHESI